MNKRRISFFANDLGPARNLVLVANEALGRGHQVMLVGNQSLRRCALLEECDVLVTGLSSFQNEEELELGQLASIKGIPWLVLADTHLAWGRFAAEQCGAIAIVASTTEIQMARKFGYKDAVYLGGPPLWKTFSSLVSPKIDRWSEEKIILVGGIKDMGITNDFLQSVVDAMKEMGILWRLIFKPHPNEKKTPEGSVQRAEILADVNLLGRPEGTENLLGSVDLSIHTSGATATIAAAYQRLPVIYYEDEAVRQRMLEVSGTPGWFPAEAGACRLATPETMAEEIRKLLFDEEERRKIREQQAKVYPVIEGTLPEKQILDFLEKTFERR